MQLLGECGGLGQKGIKGLFGKKTNIKIKNRKLYQ